jgi:hypothetical protein
VESERCDAATLVVFEELEVVEGATAAAETAEDVVPSGLALVAVGEGDVGVREWVAGGRGR